MTKLLSVVETPAYLSKASKLLNDQERAAVVDMIAAAPNLGVVMRETGDLPGAVTAWERYLEIDPNGEHAADIRQELANLKRAG